MRIRDLQEQRGTLSADAIESDVIGAEESAHVVHVEWRQAHPQRDHDTESGLGGALLVDPVLPGCELEHLHDAGIVVLERGGFRLPLSDDAPCGFHLQVGVTGELVRVALAPLHFLVEIYDVGQGRPAVDVGLGRPHISDEGGEEGALGALPETVTTRFLAARVRDDALGELGDARLRIGLTEVDEGIETRALPKVDEVQRADLHALLCQRFTHEPVDLPFGVRACERHAVHLPEVRQDVSAGLSRTGRADDRDVEVAAGLVRVESECLRCCQL